MRWNMELERLNWVTMMCLTGKIVTIVYSYKLPVAVV